MKSNSTVIKLMELLLRSNWNGFTGILISTLIIPHFLLKNNFKKLYIYFCI